MVEMVHFVVNKSRRGYFQEVRLEVDSALAFYWNGVCEWSC